MLKHIPFYASLMNRNLQTGATAKYSHVLVYGAIEAHSLGEKGCIASNKLIAAETGLKEVTVANTISALSKAGWVKVSLTANNHRMSIEPLMMIVPASLTSEPPSLTSEAQLHSPVNIDYIENTVESTTDFLGDEKKENSAKEKEAPKPADVLAVVIGIVNAREKVTAERVRLINARLKDYSASDITGAAHQLAKSKWHKDNKQMSVDNLLAPSKFGRWYAQYTDAIPRVSPPRLTREEMMRIDAEDAERRKNRDWGF